MQTIGHAQAFLKYPQEPDKQPNKQEVSSSPTQP